ncbi:oxidoreductase [Saccharopolyspora sp. HNM0983]|uniref:Oxidoreductase n=1 Tax=Saccharopolyspora montiporae TaxID=2781240 RepID=A0A929B852_9PSEU|nr:PDR/VanB family oxidoreductase [Saccharopolyspora sp. HNM0983]MBE9372963.1 oxidoreductase [Saccharopolyspora sp. HNM0983]
MTGKLGLPADLYGRRRADRSMRVLRALIGGTEWIRNYRAGRRHPVTPVDRDLAVLVDEVREVAADVVALRLRAAGGGPLPAWQPGAHVDVLLPSGRMRQYSLCGDPADRGHYRIAVRRLADGGGGSREVHGLRPGDRLTLRGPRNAFPFATAERYLFLAGGIGITPILPMVRAAAARGADWRLVHTGRTRESMPFAAELARLDPQRVWIRPDTEYGIPASGAELLEHAPSGASVYCCGPVPMITGVRIDLPGADVGALHFERFSEPPVTGGAAFGVQLARSGIDLQVPADRSALSVIRERLPQVAYSCRQGFCGTCRVRVLSGEVEHRDHVLTDEEREQEMMICVSRSAGGRVRLDL